MMRADAPPLSPSTGRPELREFQRAYKACIPCRKRKSRCELGADDYAAGRPCARCRRELKECVFTAERQIAKHHHRRNSSGGSSGRPTTHAGVFDKAEMPRRRDPVDDDFKMPEQQQPLASPIQRSAANGLPDSMMRTVVSSGSDALNLLFEAAHQQEAAAAAGDQATPLTSPNPAAGNAALYTPTLGSAFSASRARLPQPSTSDVGCVWNACRFVKMGWFSASEAVLLIDL